VFIPPSQNTPGKPGDECEEIASAGFHRKACPKHNVMRDNSVLARKGGVNIGTTGEPVGCSMDWERAKQEISLLVKDLFVAQGFVLVDFILRHDGSGFLLGLFVDRPQGGISLGECSLLNRSIRQILDEKNIFSGQQYTLEVSSPGVDRPLKTKEDFMRCLNKQAVFFLNDLVDGKCEWKGLISKVSEAAVSIDHGGVALEIPLIKINKAKLVI